jgi:salicylate hydroxylase
MASLSIGICGGGVGGLAAAISFGRAGHTVSVFEQTPLFKRVGADVNLTPNAVRALDSLGGGPDSRLGQALRASAAQPTHRISRTWDTGEVTSKLEMAEAAVARYGAPQLTIHRADLQAETPAASMRMGERVTGIVEGGPRPAIQLASGGVERFDVVIGADGIHSVVRTALLGPDKPVFTGLVSYRSVVPSEKLSIPYLDAFTKWWGPAPDIQIVTFPLNRGRETFVFATTSQDDWREESWTLPGDVAELRHVYRAFHPEARALLASCTEVTKSALYVRDPLPVWSRGAVGLLGDACHPMVPFMAQGACMAIEDAVVLGRALAKVDVAGVPAALVAYEAARKPRTSRVQEGSRGNEWLKEGGNADWVYGYDAWGVTLG